MNDLIKEVFLNKEDIERIIEKLGKQITNDYKDKNLLLVSVLKGSILFTADLMRQINLYNCEVEFMCMSSYVGTKNSGGKVNVLKNLEKDVSNYDILIVEDILESGYTLKKAVELIKEKNPKSIKICTFLDKPSKRKVDIEADYVGVTVTDEFVIGYGMDYNDKCRNLPYVGIINPKYV